MERRRRLGRYQHPEFGAAYARAREEAGDAWAERAVAMAMTANAENASAVRVKYDAIRWYASKLAPKVYGDKLDLSHSGEIGLRALTDDQLDQKLKTLEATAATLLG